MGSLDVEALYPSIDQVKGPRIVAEEVQRSPLKFEGLDTHLLGVYLGTVVPKVRQIREGIFKLLPTRKAEGKRGRRPNVHGRELGGPMRKGRQSDEEEVNIGRKLDEQEKFEDDQEEEESLSKW